MTSQDTRPLAVVTGASSGIGFQLAEQFASHGYDLVVCAEDPELDTAATALRAGGTEVQAVRTDLSTADGVEALYTAVTASGRPVAAAALNAGVGLGGSFLDQDLSDVLRLIDLNVRSTVHLAKLLLPGMVARDDGRLLVTSSIASMMPGAFQAVYNASKSFLQSFVEAVQNEVKDTGIVITSLMPGPTETEFFDRAGMTDDTRMGQASKDDPATVAKQGFEALMAGKDRVVGGSVKTKAQAAASTVLPDKVKAAMHRTMAEPGTGDAD